MSGSYCTQIGLAKARLLGYIKDAGTHDCTVAQSAPDRLLLTLKKKELIDKWVRLIMESDVTEEERELEQKRYDEVTSGGDGILVLIDKSHEVRVVLETHEGTLAQLEKELQAPAVRAPSSFTGQQPPLLHHSPI
uniref:Uncharacterized protein n=1 Tax=Plectus sambesii TaxID=2011161 RepID=A0A914UHI8_9BILA